MWKLGFQIILTLLWGSQVATINFWRNRQNENSNNFASPTSNSNISGNYGVDVSTSIHHFLDKSTVQGRRYWEMMEGCYAKYNRMDCDATEKARIYMNLDQPARQHNYSDLGFKKWVVPQEAWTPLKAFWDANKDKMKEENWPSGNTYVNHWTQPSYMVSLEDGQLRGAGQAIKKTIWDGVRPLLEEWVGRKLTETSMYGIRVYKHQAVLATHVDRLPLVTSCIINVDQDLEEPWPIEVYGHDGKGYNVTMKPGEMVFYESHTVLHGRPFPLNGSFYANLFVHFIPVDHSEMNAKDFSHPFVKSNRKLNVGGHEQSQHDEEELENHRHELREGGGAGRKRETEHVMRLEEEERETEELPDEYLEEEFEEEEPQNALHAAAAHGELHVIRSILDEVGHDTDYVNLKDHNDWTALHEAVRGGHLDVVKFLVEHGAEVHHKTKGGGTPLWWARRELGPGHGVIHFLESIGAPEEGEDL